MKCDEAEKRPFNGGEYAERVSATESSLCHASQLGCCLEACVEKRNKTWMNGKCMSQMEIPF